MFRDVFYNNKCTVESIAASIKKEVQFAGTISEDKEKAKAQTEGTELTKKINDRAEIAVEACKASLVFEGCSIVTGVFALISTLIIYLHSCKPATPNICPCWEGAEQPRTTRDAM
jgi:hypothetical protein